MSGATRSVVRARRAAYAEGFEAAKGASIAIVTAIAPGCAELMGHALGNIAALINLLDPEPGSVPATKRRP